MNPNSNIGRWVTFLFGPLALIAAGIIAAKANVWFGLNLDPNAVAAFIISVVFGLASLVLKWLHNRGIQEAAHLAGVSDDQVEKIAAEIIKRLPAPPQDPAPGHGAPAEPRAPGDRPPG